MAFAKWGGWTLLSESLLNGPQSVEIIVGLNFGITDAKLLQYWLTLTNKPTSKLTVRVAQYLPTFHPKVIIAHFDNGSAFGIVGSGNLTGGGQHHNVECGVFLTEICDINDLDNWYEKLKCKPLTQKIIDAYKPVNDEAKKLARSALKSPELISTLNTGATTWYKDAILSDLAEFVATPRGQKAVKNRAEGAKRIRVSLRMPTFDFDKSGWLDFYKEPEFGSIRQTYPDMAKDLNALRRTMRFLTSEPVTPARFRSVFNRNGSFHVTGFGINQISKVLAVYERHKWPVLNGRVWSTLEHYGYIVPWSSDGYLQFSSDIRDALSEMGKPDFWAFDAFCEIMSRELEL